MAKAPKEPKSTLKEWRQPKAQRLMIKLWLKSYVSSPFTDALSRKIDIEKKSGTKRARSSDKAKEALDGYLNKIGMTPEQWQQLCEEAGEIFLRNEEGKIYIPRHHLAGMCVQVVKTTPKSVRGPFTGDSFRAEVQIGNFQTEKVEHDELYDRYIRNEGTNQRRQQIDQVLRNFEATGEVTVVDADQCDDFIYVLRYGLAKPGLGSARKMGHGRGEVLSVEKLD